jgi:dTDP-4-dehydrorhamnose 3,5-epimerase
MKFHPAPLRGAYSVEIGKRGDDCGFFERVFCENEFTKAGLIPKFGNRRSHRCGSRLTLFLPI